VRRCRWYSFTNRVCLRFKRHLLTLKTETVIESCWNDNFKKQEQSQDNPYIRTHMENENQVDPKMAGAEELTAEDKM